MSQIELKSLEDLRRYSQDLAGRTAEDDSVVRKWRVAKRIVWMLLLAGSLLFFYLTDKFVEALAMLR